MCELNDIPEYDRFYILEGDFRSKFSKQRNEQRFQFMAYRLNGYFLNKVHEFLCLAKCDEIYFYTFSSYQKTIENELWPDILSFTKYLDQLDSAIILEILAYLSKMTKDKISKVRILEAACGEGRLLKKIHSRFQYLRKENLFGIDFNIDLVRKASRKGLNVFRQNVSSVAFKDEAFDIVIASGLLTYKVVDSIKGSIILDELIRVLKPRDGPLPGLMILTGTNPTIPDFGNPEMNPKLRFQQRCLKVAKLTIPYRLLSQKYNFFRDFVVLEKY